MDLAYLAISANLCNKFAKLGSKFAMLDKLHGRLS